MPDQLPSAILDSANSFDSLFALDLDTKQRFDNILTGQQKPIDYPLPDYQKEANPKGLPQDDLLNPNKMAGSIGEALFSTDPKIASYATDKLRQSQSNLPVASGVGVPDRFRYSKELNKYLNGDWGYNPYMSVEDNEDFNYRYDYLNQGLFTKIFKNVGTGLTHFVGGVALKLGQTLGYLGSMITNGIEEIFDPKGNNFMADVADNSMSRWFEGLEQDMKDSNLLSVFKPKGWDDMGFFKKLGSGAFWTDEIADGAAFMGEMVASMYLLGGIGKIGAIGKLGETEINLTKAMARLGSFGKGTGKALDFMLKAATGADNLSGVGRWAFSTTSESALEASGLYHQRKDQLRADRQAGRNQYTDSEIEKIVGDEAAASFKANLLILSASNAFENRFIFGPLFKRFGAAEPHPSGKLTGISKSTESVDDFLKASRKEYKYATWLGKKLDWKNSNSRLRFYGSRGLSAIAAEGFWEENAQLAVERLAGADKLTLSSFVKQLGKQTVGALSGNDPEAATNIGLGGLIGIGGTSIVAKVRGGDKLFQGERRKIESDTQGAINVYEQFRRGFLNYQDIYIRDPQTGKPIMDGEGKLQIDEVKAAGLLEGTNKFLSKQAAADKVTDPLFRKQLQDDAMMDYVVAAKMAGIFDRTVKRFNALKDADPQQLQNLGFDPATTVDAVYMRDSLEQFGKIYDSVQNSPSPKLGKTYTKEDDANRKHALYRASSGVYSASKLIAEYQSKMQDRDFPSAFSPEAEGSTSEIQAYNSLVYQEERLDQFAAMAKENGTFYDGYVRNEKSAISTQKAQIEKNLGMAPLANVKKNSRGLFYSPSKYTGYTPLETAVMEDMENEAQRKHAEYTNVRAQKQYLVNQFSNPNDGIKNYKDYIDFIEVIQGKDAAEDEKTPPPNAPVEPGQAPPVNVPTAPVETTPVVTSVTEPTATKKEAVTSQEVIVQLTNLMAQARAVLIVDDPADPPDYKTIAAVIADNLKKKNLNAIIATLVEFVKSSGDVVLQQVKENTYSPTAIAANTYNVTAVFMDELLASVDDDEIANAVIAYMNTVDTAISTYAPIQALTEAEINAHNLLASLNLANTSLAPYGIALANVNATPSEIKQALKGISDQLALNPIDAGEALGQAASLAIEELGYPAPEVQDTTKAIETIEAPVLNDLETLAAKAGVTETATPVDEIVPTEVTPLPDLRKEPIEVKISDRFSRTYPLEINGLDTNKLIEIAKFENETDELPQEYFDNPQKIEDEFGKAAGDYFEAFSYGMSREEAIFYKNNPEFTDKLTDLLGEHEGELSAPEFAKYLLENNSTLVDQYQLNLFETKTQAAEASADTENSGVQPTETAPVIEYNEPDVPKGTEPPQPPPPAPTAPENSDEAANESENYIDVIVDEAKKNARFAFPQNMPEEVVMEGNKAKIAGGAIQLKTTQGDQQAQLLRQHNILKTMGERTNPTNFWSEDEEGKPMFQIKLELAGIKNGEKYAPWVYNTAKGLTNPATGKPYDFPYIVAMVVDQAGTYVYFDNNGNVSDRVKGLPFGFPYAVEDYKPGNLDTSRRGLQLGTGEALNGKHGFLNDTPLRDVNEAVIKGIPIYGSIDEVASGKLSTYNVDNSGATFAKTPQQRTVKEMVTSGDISDDTPFILTSGQYFEYSSSTNTGAPTQQIKVGQPYIFDEKSGTKIPLRGKKIKDLTIDGVPFVDSKMKAVLESLSETGIFTIGEEPTDTSLQLMQNIFNTLRALVYSRNTPVFINQEGTTISMLDQRPTNKSLLETEVNYSTNINILTNPFELESEGFDYQDFVKENFLSGAVPAELTKGQKSFEKLNRRIIFTLDKTHQEILDSIGAKADPAKTIRIKMTDFSKFVNKTFKKKGGTSTVTVTGFKDGNFTVTGPSGTVQQSTTDFMNSLKNLEEVKLSAPSEEVKEDFQNNIKLTEAQQKELNEKAKNMTKDDLDNLNFDC